MKDLKYFKTKDFHGALRHFFKSLNIPVNYIAEEPARPQDILSRTYKEEKEPFQLMEDVYFLGMVDDAAFEGGPSLDYRKIESDYDGILIFGVTLQPRDNGLSPTRSQLAEITRAFNREFHYTPVVVVFRYGDSLAFANAERLPYKQEWREGEKAGKVSLLRDVDIDAPHSGHLRILSELAISRSGKQAVNTFAALYSYWQTVFNVSLLNKNSTKSCPIGISGPSGRSPFQGSRPSIHYSRAPALPITTNCRKSGRNTTPRILSGC